eukprot:c14781_g1_i1.p1 GENE.c14781_g1_i1~~c14781_g1_i1.p1  ORF type:complete len:366 (+),score=73.45 c14781_g1_i1:24-1121(+)
MGSGESRVGDFPVQPSILGCTMQGSDGQYQIDIKKLRKEFNALKKRLHKGLLDKKDTKHILAILKKEHDLPPRLMITLVAQVLRLRQEEYSNFTEHAKNAVPKLPVPTIQEQLFSDVRVRWVGVLLVAFHLPQQQLLRILKNLANAIGMRDGGLEGSELWKILEQSQSIRNVPSATNSIQKIHTAYKNEAAEGLVPSLGVSYLLRATRRCPTEVVPYNEALYFLLEVLISRIRSMLLLHTNSFNSMLTIIENRVIFVDPKNAKQNSATPENIRHVIDKLQVAVSPEHKAKIIENLGLQGSVIPYNLFLPQTVEQLFRASAAAFVEKSLAAQEQLNFWKRLSILEHMRCLSGLPKWFANQFDEIRS